MEIPSSSRSWLEPLLYLAALVLMVRSVSEPNTLYLAAAFLCITATVRKGEPGWRVYLGAGLLLAALAVAYHFGKGALMARGM